MDNHYGLGAFGGQRQIMGDQQQRRAQFVGESLQMVEHLPLHGDVQRRRRLVGDQQLRSAGQPDGDERTLTHASRKLVRVLAGLLARIGHPGLGEQLHRPSPGLAGIGVGPQRFPDLEADLPNRVEIGHRVLGYITDATAPDLSELPAVGRGDVDAVENDAAGGNSPAGRKQPEDRGGRGGFPRTRFADDGDGVSALDRQVHTA